MYKKLILGIVKGAVTSSLSVCLLFSSFNVYTSAVNYGDELDSTEKSYTKTFSDVDRNHWAFKYIGELTERGAISGYPDGKFRPDKTVTRAEFAKIMVMAAGLTAKKSNYSSYADVSVTDWSSPYIETVKDYMTGYIHTSGETIFKPDSAALREDVAVGIVKLKGYDMRLADISMIKTMFTDFDGISESAQKYVALAVENGLISGYPDETFKPQSTITRAQVAAILWRAFQYGNDNKITDQTPVVDLQKDVPSITDEEDEDKKDTSKEITKKYSIETLAKVDSPESMVTDKDGNVYFIYDNQIKKLANNKTSTLANGNKDFSFNKPLGEVAKEIINNNIDLKSDLSYLESSQNNYCFGRFILKGLVYDQSSDKVYAQGYFEGDRAQRIGAHFLYVWLTAMYDVNNVSKPVASYCFTSNGENDEFYKPDGLLIAADNGGILFSGDDRWECGTSDYTIYRFNTNNGGITKYADLGNTVVDCGTSAMLSTGYTIVYRASSSIIIMQHDLSSGKFSEKTVNTKSLVDGNITSFTENDGSFYFFAGNDIYSVLSSGVVKKYIDSDEIAVKDSLPLGKVTQFTFDKDGNILFYDATNKAIRRLNV